MAKIIEEGRVCVKLTGRDAGKQVVITKVVNDKNVMIRSPERQKGKKERNCAVKQLEPTPHKIDISKEKEISKVLNIE
ncbi:50S ribosomal protein L14e [Candidatus Micrarchaeota archaeon]|nr:50S ribosomal protein L14e [Candidatus Micrarchaeota archaeon]